jgi:hypothetical protein
MKLLKKLKSSTKDSGKK